MRFGIGILLALLLSATSASAQESASHPHRGAILGTVIGAAAGAAGAAIIMIKPCTDGFYGDRALCRVVTPVGLIGGGAIAGFFIGRGGGSGKRAAVAPRVTPELSAAEIASLAASVRLPGRAALHGHAG